MFLLFPLLSLLVGCGDGAIEDTGAAVVGPCDTGLNVTWDNWGHGFFRTYCTSCHSIQSPNRYDAPEGIDFDTEAEVAQWAASIKNAVLVTETMPVGGGVYEDDLALLERYLDCGLASR